MPDYPSYVRMIRPPGYATRGIHMILGMQEPDGSRTHRIFRIASPADVDWTQDDPLINLDRWCVSCCVNGDRNNPDYPCGPWAARGGYFALCNENGTDWHPACGHITWPRCVCQVAEAANAGASA